MKEYKVVTIKLVLRKWTQNFEDLLNQYAREGWTVVSIPEGYGSVVFERDKNR